VSALRRFWHHRLGKITVTVVAAFVVFVAAAFSAAAYTERNSFCIEACHEMGPYGSTWEHSAHRDLDCVRCHIEPGFVNFVQAKVYALREVYVHVTGEVKAPIAVTRHIPDSTCEDGGCHPAGEVTDPIAFATSSFSHAGHPEVPRCIDCHAQVVHTGTPGRPFVDPASMAACLACHDGMQAADTCDTCHEAPHDSRGACADCHELASWRSTFEHPVRLTRTHGEALCEKCHTQSTATETGPPDGCVGCHKKRHGAGGKLCAECHTVSRWVPSTFDHPKSGCADCHERPHPDRGSCTRCHTTSSWASRFDHPVALGGVHAGFACERCHTNGLDAPGRACVSCHGDRHGGGLTDCTRCHSTSAWSPSTFRHPQEGPHIPAGEEPLRCAACHPSSFGAHSCPCHGGGPPDDD
jgi:nitrate/TMAO reductase-like tetraheme cytochrome c subunit